jgi:type IV secretion system protein VirB4
MASSKTSPRPPSKPSSPDEASKDLESFRDIADDVIESDFVPYACLFAPDVIATKDGELLQTIKINGAELDAQTGVSLRQAIRNALRAAIPDTSYAIWLHTLRRHQPSAGHSHFPDAFSGKLDEAWRTQYPTSTSFVNELYITIVKAGEESALTNVSTLIQSLVPGRTNAARTAAMDIAMRELTATTDRLVKALNTYGARILGLVERERVFYSEQLEFLEKLINLEARPMPVPIRDLSHVLTSGEITFGYNAMEVRTADNHRRFAAILTVKEYKESTLAGIDKFLNIPCEVIITQTFDFLGGVHAREAYEKQARYLTISGDKELAKWIEIDRLMADSNAASARNFGEQQTSLFLIAHSISQLEKNIKLVQKALNRLGMVIIREDLRFEECYWAQLPGNFAFLTRNHAVDTEHLAGFANLQTAPMGNAKGSPWGGPVSVFTTLQDAPYYFNFHTNQTAHTIVLGKPGAGATSFTHFLLAQARKLPIAIWYLDTRGRAAPLMQAMGGTMLQPGGPGCRLNPFQMEDTPTNREFLAIWLSTLVDPHGLQLNQSTLAFFQSLIDHIYKLPKTSRQLSSLIPLVREADAVLATTMQQFCMGGKYGDLFDMPADDFKTPSLIGWDLSRWMGSPATQVPLASYLLHRITMGLSGEPTLIVLDEGFTLLDNPLFGVRAAQWCDYLTSRNAALLIATHDVEASGNYAFTPGISAKAASIFALANTDPESGYTVGFGFTPQDISTLAYIDGAAHQILQKRGAESVVVKMDLSTLSAPALATLGGKAATPDTRSPADQLADLMGYTKHAV